MDIVSAIADELVKVSPGASIYRENQPQGFDEPCFYVYPIKSSGQDQLSNHQMRNHSYCATWFPDPEKGPMEQCEAMRDKLLDDFNYIEIGTDKYRAFKKEAQITDAVVVFTFNLRYRTLDVVETTKMTSFKTLGGNKVD